MRRARCQAVATAVACVVALGSATTSADGPTWRDRIVLTASERLRGELVDWFEPPPGAAPRGANRYAYLGSQLRIGTRITFPHVQAVLEMQDTRIASLPDDASLPPPFGPLGPGAVYFANTHQRDQGEPFLKLGFVTVRRSGLAATVGRFEYSDGLETIPGDRTLAILKRMRIAERLVGPFGFTHVTRSLDAVRVTWDRPEWNATAFAGRPTRGGFEVSANREIDDMSLAGLALTAKRLPSAPPVDLRAFYLFYEDARDAPLKVDNRPLAARTADHDAIAVHTAGAHALTVIDAGPGALDLLGWTALQAGEWGELDHGAWAWALEAGYQLARLPAAPWLRAGWNRSSGDDDPLDGDHATFFQVLPTSRIYAQLPFFNLMSNEDLFGQLILQPHPAVTVRTDYHWLRVGEPRDLWYSGGGATNNDLFGFTGTPTGGARELAHLVDVSLALGPWYRFSFNVYYGHAFGAGVVRGTFAGADADYGFADVTWRY